MFFPRALGTALAGISSGVCVFGLILDFDDAIPKLSLEEFEVDSRRIALKAEPLVTDQAQDERQGPGRLEPPVVN